MMVPKGLHSNREFEMMSKWSVPVVCKLFAIVDPRADYLPKYLRNI
jgi:hypothetical protein